MKVNTFSFRALALGFTCLLLFATNGKAQLRDKATFFGGITYQIISMTPQGQVEPWRYPFYGIGAGMDYVLAHSNDQFSLGINPNAHFSFQFSSLYGTSLLAQAPVFALARYGAHSTPYNEQKFGIGAGLGVTPTYIRTTTVASSGGQAAIYDIREGFVNPAAVVEMSLRTRRSDYLFRFNWSLGRPLQELEEFNGLPFRLASGGFSLMYTF